MRSLVTALVGVILASTCAVAQISVQIRIPKDDFLVDEAIPLEVSIRNFSGRTIQLDDNGDKPWLHFLVTSEDNNIIPATGRLPGGGPILIPPEETISRTIDLLPLFLLRSRGTFSVRANVDVGSVMASSTPVRFSLINGREIWQQTVGLPSVEGGSDVYCRYAVVARRDGDEELLYVSVRYEPAETIFSLIPLGPALPTGDPQAIIDKDHQLHVLYQNGPRSYGYTQVGPAAKVLSRAAYSDFMSRPELVNREGVVKVMGGEQTYPRPEHILTDDELNPPPPPAKPKPKKKWWWPFGPGSQASGNS